MLSDRRTNIIDLLEHYTKATESVTSRPLQTGGGGGTYDGMEVVDAKIAAAEARTDAKFERMIGEFSTMRAEINGRLDHIEKSTSGIRLNIWLAAASILALSVAAMGFGATQFGNGVMLTTAAVEDAATAKGVAENNALQVQELRKDIQGMIQAFEASKATEQR